MYRVEICNLGDSGYIHIRDGCILSESVSQTHYFNCPFQLSLKTPNESSISDNPEKADFYKIEELLPQGNPFYCSIILMFQLKMF